MSPAMTEEGVPRGGVVLTSEYPETDLQRFSLAADWNHPDQWTVRQRRISQVWTGAVNPLSPIPEVTLDVRIKSSILPGLVLAGSSDKSVGYKCVETGDPSVQILPGEFRRPPKCTLMTILLPPDLEDLGYVCHQRVLPEGENDWIDNSTAYLKMVTPHGSCIFKFVYGDVSSLLTFLIPPNRGVMERTFMITSHSRRPDENLRVSTEFDISRAKLRISPSEKEGRHELKLVIPKRVSVPRRTDATEPVGNRA